MPTAHLYYPDDLYIQYKQLADGEASKLFQNALREHFGATQDINQIQKKLSSLYEENNVVSSKINYLETKKKELELQATKEQEKLIEAQKREEAHKEISKQKDVLEKVNYIVAGSKSLPGAWIEGITQDQAFEIVINIPKDLVFNKDNVLKIWEQISSGDERK